MASNMARIPSLKSAMFKIFSAAHSRNFAPRDLSGFERALFFDENNIILAHENGTHQQHAGST